VEDDRVGREEAEEENLEAEEDRTPIGAKNAPARLGRSKSLPRASRQQGTK